MLEEIGYQGQLKLKDAKVCVVGVSGLGNPITTRLVAMGVGKLRIIDRDVIELSNLHRQTMFDESDVGEIKVEVAARKLQKLNPDVQIEALPLSVNDYNVLEVVDGCDVVIGSRFLNVKSNSPKYRKTGIRIITKASNIGTKFKVTDAQSGFRAYSKKVIQEINPTEKGMSVST